MKSTVVTAAVALTAAPAPSSGDGRWTAVLRSPGPAGPIDGRLTFQRRPDGTRWNLECRDLMGSRSFDGTAPREDESVMGQRAGPGGGRFTLALRGEHLWMSWIPGCLGMTEPDAIIRNQ